MKTLLIVLALTMISCAATQPGKYTYYKDSVGDECYVELSSGRVVYLEDGACHEFHLMADVNGNPRHEDRSN